MRWRWGVVTLAAWYAAAVLTPVALGVALLGPGFLGSEPPDSEPARRCGAPMECGPFFPDVWQVRACCCSPRACSERDFTR